MKQHIFDDWKNMKKSAVSKKLIQNDENETLEVCLYAR